MLHSVRDAPHHQLRMLHAVRHQHHTHPPPTPLRPVSKFTQLRKCWAHSKPPTPTLPRVLNAGWTLEYLPVFKLKVPTNPPIPQWCPIPDSPSGMQWNTKWWGKVGCKCSCESTDHKRSKRGNVYFYTQRAYRYPTSGSNHDWQQGCTCAEC